MKRAIAEVLAVRTVGRLLVVDPSLLERQRIAGILEAVGYEVILSDSPSDAIEQVVGAEPGSICAVITELNFPTGDVNDLIHALRTNPAWVHIPIIVLTPQPPLARVVELARAGVTTILSKPFSAVVLLRRLRDCMEDCAAPVGDQRVSWTLTEYVSRELKRADRSRSHLSLTVLRLPPDIEEEEMPELIRSLMRNLRQSDLVVRIAPREIALVLPDADARAAQAVVRRLQVLLPGTVTAGIAVYPTEAADANVLLHLARERAGAALQMV